MNKRWHINKQKKITRTLVNLRSNSWGSGMGRRMGMAVFLSSLWWFCILSPFPITGTIFWFSSNRLWPFWSKSSEFPSQNSAEKISVVDYHLTTWIIYIYTRLNTAYIPFYILKSVKIIPRNLSFTSFWRFWSREMSWKVFRFFWGGVSKHKTKFLCSSLVFWLFRLSFIRSVRK